MDDETLKTHINKIQIEKMRETNLKIYENMNYFSQHGNCKT
jgi:hypothetical protein